jgi:septum formation protein
LSSDEVRRYVEREQPLDCAGSFKAEALGIALFERIDSSDPTGLTGLPLIWLSGVLRHLGFEIP